MLLTVCDRSFPSSTLPTSSFIFSKFFLVKLKFLCHTIFTRDSASKPTSKKIEKSPSPPPTSRLLSLCFLCFPIPPADDPDPHHVKTRQRDQQALPFFQKPPGEPALPAPSLAGLQHRRVVLQLQFGVAQRSQPVLPAGVGKSARVRLQRAQQQQQPQQRPKAEGNDGCATAEPVALAGEPRRQPVTRSGQVS